MTTRPTETECIDMWERSNNAKEYEEMYDKAMNQTTEQPVTIHTFFKVSLTEPLQALKESFMEEYKDQPEMLKNAGFTGV